MPMLNKNWLKLKASMSFVTAWESIPKFDVF